MDKLTKEIFKYLLESEEKRQTKAHKSFDSNCEYCKKLKELKERLKKAVVE